MLSNTDVFSDFAGSFPFKPNVAELVSGNMCYVDEGQGDPVLFVHGNPTWSYLYRHLIKGLSKENRTIAPDHLGFGRSAKPEKGAYTLGWHIQNLTEFILKLNLKKITLVLHDWGGPIGLGFAVKNTSLVKRLVLMNTWSFYTSTETQLVEILETLRKPVIGEELILQKNMFIEKAIPGGIYNKEKVTKQLMDAYRAPFHKPEHRQSMLKLVREIPSGSKGESTEIILEIQKSLRLLTVPTLVIWGEKDPVFPVDIIKFWKLYFPEADIHLIENASHFLQEDNPEKILGLLSEFLEKNP